MLSQRRPPRRDDRGAIAVITAIITSMVLFVVAALTVDIGNAWARRGQLQAQVDGAALFAGQYLPAALPATKLRAAKAAIWYIACVKPVAGQDADFNADYPIPRGSDGRFICDGPSFTPSSTTYDAAAAAMIGNGAISFPNRFEIKVTSPFARITFGFGGVVGAEGSTQQKVASAHVYSAGGVVPMGGSVGCLAAAANNTQLLGVGTTLQNLVPINYFSAGSSGTSTTGTSSTAPTFGDPDTINSVAYNTPRAVPAPANRTWTTKGDLNLQTATANADFTQLSVTFTANANFPPSTATNVVAALPALSLSGPVTGVFRRVTLAGVTETVVSQAATSLAGAATLQIPAQVKNAPGDWFVKILWAYPNYSKVDVGVPNVLVTTTYTQSLSPATTLRLSSNAAKQITVPASAADVTNLDNFLSCAKPVVSPRSPTGGDSQDMIDNIRRGVDHVLDQHPSVITALGGASGIATTPISTLAGPSSILADPTKFAFSCSVGDGVSVLDTAPNRASFPNCVNVNTTRSWSYEFTQGFLTGSGRLSCSVAACEHGTFPGSELGLNGSYNNDKITDFISGTNKQSVLDDMLLTSLDTFLTPSVPVATPADLLSQDLYSSPRFFWAPVLTTAFSTSTNAFYPILTFRPTFITEETPSTSATQALINALSVETVNDLKALAASGVSSLLGLGLISGLTSSLGLSTTTANLLTSLNDPTKVEKYGLVLDTSAPVDSQLKALRVMNINPGALPAVDPDYDGPINDYLGSGPKIVRLVL